MPSLPHPSGALGPLSSFLYQTVCQLPPRKYISTLRMASKRGMQSPQECWPSPSLRHSLYGLG
ncbi:hypothetical protein AB1N83_011216 [Pleurotus pulmonarius]